MIMPYCLIKKRSLDRLRALSCCIWFPGPGAGTSHMASLLGQGMVHWQHELDGTILLPTPSDLGESAAEAGQKKQAFGQDDHTGHQQRECEGGRQVELVAALLKGTGPAIGECVQRAQHQGHKAQCRLQKKRGLE